MDLSRHMVLAGGRLRPVRGAIDEGDIGRYEEGPRKAVSAGIRGKELIILFNLQIQHFFYSQFSFR